MDMRPKQNFITIINVRQKYNLNSSVFEPIKMCFFFAEKKQQASNCTHYRSSNIWIWLSKHPKWNSLILFKMKPIFCFRWDRRCFCSPHIGILRNHKQNIIWNKLQLGSRLQQNMTHDHTQLCAHICIVYNVYCTVHRVWDYNTNARTFMQLLGKKFFSGYTSSQWLLTWNEQSTIYGKSSLESLLLFNSWFFTLHRIDSWRKMMIHFYSPKTI